mmetsp:Transcript_4951/g.12112  ORF Transcript_4951/g.12112 Transcript_4951/m.12112 type:complete len:82 (-) Transcript_4951:60-305(-)
MCVNHGAFIVSFLYRFLSSSLLRVGSRGSSVVVLDRSAQRCDDSTITFALLCLCMPKKNQEIEGIGRWMNEWFGFDDQMTD